MDAREKAFDHARRDDFDSAQPRHLGGVEQIDARGVSHGVGGS